jgi:hypothetical protein
VAVLGTITMASVGRIPNNRHALSFASALYTAASQYSPPTLIAVGEPEDWVLNCEQHGCLER